MQDPSRLGNCLRNRLGKRLRTKNQTWDYRQEQAEAEVVPSLVQIKVEVGVKVEVQFRCNLDAIQMQLRGNFVEVVLSLKTTFSVGVCGGVAGWLEKTGLRLSHL